MLQFLLMDVWHYASLEDECHKSLGVILFLLQFFLHSLRCHFKEEADKMLVGCFRANHAESGNIFLTGFGGDDEKRMTQA